MQHQDLGNTLHFDSFICCVLPVQIMSSGCWTYCARKTILYLSTMYIYQKAYVIFADVE